MGSEIALLVLVVLAVPVMLIVALVSISGLKRRVASLEDALARSTAWAGAPPNSADASAARAARSAAPSATQTMSSRAEPAAKPVPSPTTTSPVSPPPMSTPMPPAAVASASLPPVAAPLFPPLPPRSTKPDPVTVAARTVKHWFTVGNVPVKVGMLVLLAGVAALLKYASDQGWLRMPIEFRLAGIALAAMAALVFGWRQRDSKRAFALALQGGAIGVLLLTVFAAFKLYALLPATAAFALSVALVAGLGVLAVAQDSRTLAVLGILAGFLAPIWLSTGSGNHVALFSYYAILNAAIFAIAWWRPWRVLNLLGFAFTFGIGTAWGVLQYSPQKMPSTEPFLVLFFIFYLLIPILYARKRPASKGDRIDGCLVFATPLVAFSLQAALLHGERMLLALCAVALGAVYAVLARALIRRERYAALGQSYALLAVGFATLAVPLAFSANATACVFALEGAALVWLGLRQERVLPQWTGLGLQLAAGCAFAIGVQDGVGTVHAVANAAFMGALLMALAGFASAWCYRQREGTHREGVQRVFAIAATGYYVWGIGWWSAMGFREIDLFVDPMQRADAMLAFVALTGWLAAEAHRFRPARALVLTALAAFVLAAPLAFAQAEAHSQPFAGYGLWAWFAFAALGIRSLWCLRTGEDRFAGWAQFVWWLLWPLVGALFASYLAQRFQLAEGWQWALVALPWLAAAWASIDRWPVLSTPLDARFDVFRPKLQIAYFICLGAWWLVAMFNPGESQPLPWIAVLNPLDLTQLGAVVLFGRWLWSPHAPQRLRTSRIFILSAAGFAMVTLITLRGVHHWGGVAWDGDLLSTSLAQTGLTVVWSVLGVVGWVLGSRRGQRGVWLAGAVLMGIVLAKLVFVDRQHLGNLLGIASFL
ncbi:MAG: DUF2339 domain-containing protein, partial [Luteimonas sp.]